MEPTKEAPNIMLHVGLDLSRRRLDFDLLCEDGSRLESGAVPPDADGLRGLARRNLLSSGWWLGWVWVYWLILSLASWRAFLQLFRTPHRWEKTTHGLARSSRLADMSAAPGWGVKS